MPQTTKMIGTKLLCFMTIFKCAYTQIPTANKQESDLSIIENEFDNSNIANGQYKFRYVNSDGTERQESGGFDNDGNYVITGSYSYIDESGKPYVVHYSADKDGYHPLPATEGVVVISAPPGIVASLLG
ncbi:unnamed protein product [Chilo suppressalis]|uniref:Uncharacterized protein n=1 Tax=Chilo suppressalis TaxID=168631 RepID=A0ABN8BET5_CHISP|nr:hypothetical protein evm_009751 [Chilo suppressalis]CAH0407734.1 unnamed protein product [Chilo suppressalis]